MRIFINLLPPAKKKDLQSSMILAYAQTIVFIFFLTSIVVSATLFSLRMVLADEHEYLSKLVEKAGSAESSDIVTNIQDINTFLVSANSLQQSFIPWVDVVNDIAPLVPDGTRLERFRTDAANRIFLDGIAATREDSLVLLKSLESQPYLTDVQSPLSNILQKTDVRFSFETKYQEPAGAESDTQ